MTCEELCGCEAFEISDLRSKLLSVNLIWEIDIPWMCHNSQLVSHPELMEIAVAPVAPWLQIHGRNDSDD